MHSARLALCGTTCAKLRQKGEVPSDGNHECKEVAIYSQGSGNHECREAAIYFQGNGNHECREAAIYSQGHDNHECREAAIYFSWVPRPCMSRSPPQLLPTSR